MSNSFEKILGEFKTLASNNDYKKPEIGKSIAENFLSVMKPNNIFVVSSVISDKKQLVNFCNKAIESFTEIFEELRHHSCIIAKGGLDENSVSLFFIELSTRKRSTITGKVNIAIHVNDFNTKVVLQDGYYNETTKKTEVYRKQSFYIVASKENSSYYDL